MENFSWFYIISPLSGAIIGYFTNWVAIKMLFRPHEEKYLFGKRLPFTPGLIPKRRFVLAKKVGETISMHLLTDSALSESMCTPEVKKNIEDMLRGMFDSLKSSEKRIGSYVDNELFDKEIKSLTDKAFDYFISQEFTNIVEKAEQNIIANEKTVREILPDGIADNLPNIIKSNSAKISEKVISFLESDFFEEKIKPVIISLIDQNVGGLASLFVIPEKVYRNTMQKVVEYFENPVNYDSTAEKLIGFTSKMLEAKVGDIAKQATSDEKRLLSSFIQKNAGSGNELLIKLSADAKEHVSVRLSSYLLSLKLSDIFSKIDIKYVNALINIIMARYEKTVRMYLPALLQSINFANLIESRINSFDVNEAEEIIISVVDKELKAITYLGGLLGFIIGSLPPVLEMLGVK